MYTGKGEIFSVNVFSVREKTTTVMMRTVLLVIGYDGVIEDTWETYYMRWSNDMNFPFYIYIVIVTNPGRFDMRCAFGAWYTRLHDSDRLYSKNIQQYDVLK